MTELDRDGLWFCSEFLVWCWLVYAAATFTEFTSLRDVIGVAAVWLATLLGGRLERRAAELQQEVRRLRDS